MTKQKQNNILNPIPYFIVCLVVITMFDFISTNQILHNIFISTDNFKLLDIVYVQNTGAAFSSFQHATLFLIVISILAILFIIFELFHL